MSNNPLLNIRNYFFLLLDVKEERQFYKGLVQSGEDGANWAKH